MIVRQAAPNDAAAIARIHVDSWRTTYRGIIPEAYLASLSYEEGEKRWAARLSDSAGKICVYVAENEAGQIVGFVCGGPDRDNDPVYKGELYAIYILQTAQGQGLGRRLTLALAEGLLQIGIDSMILWVFAGNPARRFYEALGGQLVKSNQFEVSGATIDEVAYAWPDIRTLLKEQKA